MTCNYRYIIPSMQFAICNTYNIYIYAYIGMYTRASRDSGFSWPPNLRKAPLGGCLPSSETQRVSWVGRESNRPSPERCRKWITLVVNCETDFNCINYTLREADKVRIPKSVDWVILELLLISSQHRFYHYTYLYDVFMDRLRPWRPKLTTQGLSEHAARTSRRLDTFSESRKIRKVD